MSDLEKEVYTCNMKCIVASEDVAWAYLIKYHNSTVSNDKSKTWVINNNEDAHRVQDNAATICELYKLYIPVYKEIPINNPFQLIKGKNLSGDLDYSYLTINNLDLAHQSDQKKIYEWYMKNKDHPIEASTLDPNLTDGRYKVIIDDLLRFKFVYDTSQPHVLPMYDYYILPDKFIFKYIPRKFLYYNSSILEALSNFKRIMYGIHKQDIAFVHTCTEHRLSEKSYHESHCPTMQYFITHKNDSKLSKYYCYYRRMNYRKIVLIHKSLFEKPLVSPPLLPYPYGIESSDEEKQYSLHRVKEPEEIPSTENIIKLLVMYSKYKDEEIKELKSQIADINSKLDNILIMLSTTKS